MQNVLNFLRKDTRKLKENAIRQKMIDYYNTINQGKVSIPAFILADLDVRTLRKQGRINELYRKLLK